MMWIERKFDEEDVIGNWVRFRDNESGGGGQMRLNGCWSNWHG